MMYVVFFMNKHLDYLHEAFSSILLGNYNAYSCLMRIILENYVSFLLIKKYKKKEIWKDWYFWSYYKVFKYIDQEPYHSKIKKQYKKLGINLDFDINIIDNAQPYGWLKRAVKLKNYSFKNACSLIDEKIYKDFSYLSRNIHNNDMISKTNWVDMKILTKFLFLMFDYTDKMINEYNYHFMRRKYYNFLSTELLESLNCCCDYTEVF